MKIKVKIHMKIKMLYITDLKNNKINEGIDEIVQGEELVLKQTFVELLVEHKENSLTQLLLKLPQLLFLDLLQLRS